MWDRSARKTIDVECFFDRDLGGNVGTREINMQRYPDSTSANIEDFRKSNWEAALDVTARTGYSDFWQTLSTAARAAVDAGRFSEGKVLWLLADVCSMMLNPESVNKPFKPMMETPHGRSPVPDDFSEAEVDLLAQISEEIGDPWIQGRLADLVWLLKRPRSPRHALAAIDAYRRIPLDAETWLHKGKECWERAISLSRILRSGAGERLSDIEASLVRAFRGATKDDGFFSLWLAEVLYASGLGRDESQSIAERLAIMAHLADQEGEVLKARSFFEASSKWFQRAKNKERSTDMTVALAETWAKDAEARAASPRPSNAVAASFYENAIQTYRTIPRLEREARRLIERIAELHRLMSEAGQRSLNEMGRIDSGPIDLTDMIDAARTAVAGKVAIEALAAFASIHRIVPVALRRKRSEELIRKYPLRTMFGSSHLSQDGRVVAKTPGISLGDTNASNYQAALRSEMIKQYEMDLGLVVQGAVWPALEVLILEHRFREVDFIEIARRSPIVPRGREFLLGKALYLGDERDFTSALHLLVPQVEHMVRWHLKDAAVKTTTLTEDGVENEIGLSALIDLPDTPKVFGDDLAFEIRALFCDAVGPNLRNRLAHGLLEYGACESIYSVYAWWLGLKLVFSTFWNIQRAVAADDEDGHPEQESKDPPTPE